MVTQCILFLNIKLRLCLYNIKEWTSKSSSEQLQRWRKLTANLRYLRDFSIVLLLYNNHILHNNMKLLPYKASSHRLMAPLHCIHTPLELKDGYELIYKRPHQVVWIISTRIYSILQKQQTHLTNSVEKSVAASLGSCQQEATASVKNCACADQASQANSTLRRAPATILTAARTKRRSGQKMCEKLVIFILLEKFFKLHSQL